MSREVEKFTFYVIALYGKKDMPFRGDKEGRFIGYFGKPIWSPTIRRIAKCMHFATREEARVKCRDMKEDMSNWFYGKVQKFSATRDGN